VDFFGFFGGLYFAKGRSFRQKVFEIQIHSTENFMSFKIRICACFRSRPFLKRNGRGAAGGFARQKPGEIHFIERKKYRINFSSNKIRIEKNFIE
jgi:hypothetical protein